VTCPICERRAAQEQKAGAECKQEVKRLQSHSQRMAILVAILGTLIGQEAFERAVAILGAVDTFAAAEQQPKPNTATQTANAGHEKQHTQDEFSGHRGTLLEYVPPLLPTLGQVDSNYVFGFDEWDEAEPLILPDTGVATPLAAALLLRPSRKRK
tara:strand:+ start:3625 stop:4089 length:465 start_codon:yes stop_codon:yes gene_type:complete